MTMLTDLNAAVAASGLRYIEVPGWRTRGRSGGMNSGAPKGVVIHYTGTSARAGGDYPSMKVVRGGRPDLGGPLAQLGLGRDGTAYIIAAGRANHAGRVDKAGSGNPYAIGIEAENPGHGGWPDVQYRAYVALAAALVTHYGIPVSMVRGHKEVAVDKYGRHGRKPDPDFSMAQFRRDVAALIARPGGIGANVARPPRDPRFGHRGIPAHLEADGVLGNRTLDALIWLVGGDRLVGLTRDNVRDIQTWVGRERTGRLTTDDVKAIQSKVGSDPDGVWPLKLGQKSNTTLAVQQFINRRAAEARQKEGAK